MWVSSDGQVPEVFYKKITESDFLSSKNGNYYIIQNKGFSTTYSRGSLCSNPANLERAKFGNSYWNPGYINEVLLENLEYNTYYTYKFGNEKVGFSEEFQFKSQPIPGVENDITFIVYGDLGSHPRSTVNN
jgi:hypothetical protein